MPYVARRRMKVAGVVYQARQPVDLLRLPSDTVRQLIDLRRIVPTDDDDRTPVMAKSGLDEALAMSVADFGRKTTATPRKGKKTGPKKKKTADKES